MGHYAAEMPELWPDKTLSPEPIPQRKPRADYRYYMIDSYGRHQIDAGDDEAAIKQAVEYAERYPASASPGTFRVVRETRDVIYTMGVYPK